MATKNVTYKISANIASLKTKLQDAKKSFQDLEKTVEKIGKNSKLSEDLLGKDLGKKVQDIKTKFTNFAKVIKDLPAPVKALAGIAALTVATKKLYDAGKKRFFEGLNNIKDTASPVLKGITSSINTVKDAFSELTGFEFNFSSIITTGAKFEAQMKKVATIAGSVGTELEQLTDKARELGAATTFSASEVGEAMEYMAMAGWSTSEMLEGVASTLNLAKIGATDLGTASDILTDDLTALGMSANQSGDFADKLAATITRSNTDVVLFGESMKQTGAVAGALGASMTDLSTSIGLMANAGIKGSKAGMSLKNLFTNMANPTDQMSAALQKLGMTADASGSYLKTTAEGCVDLEATVTALREGTEKMTRSQKAALIATVAGKNALPGIMSLVNASAEEYDKLSEAIDNSTSTVAMFNENMNIVGLRGQEASERINLLKEVFSETEISATALGLSSKDLGYAISLLSNDSKVAAKDIEELLDVIESMDNATGEIDEFWRSVGKAGNIKIDGKEINKLMDYNATLGIIDNSIVGLTSKEKDHVKSLIKEGMTLEEANAKLKQYGLEAEKISLSTLTLSQKTDYLRQAFAGMSDEEIKTKLETIGLGESFDEVSEIVNMTNDEYVKYKKNLETIQGLSDRLAKSIDQTTKSTFLALSSAIEDSLIGAFEELKPTLLGATDALIDFFTAWRNQDENVYTFEGFEVGLANLEKKVSQSAKNIPNVIKNTINNANRLISGGALDSMLNMGSSIVQNICAGIIQNKEGITQGVDSIIKRICNFIQTNGPTVEEAGKIILQAIGDGLRKNQNAIDEACDVIYSAINKWASANSANIGLLGGIVADEFITGFIGGFFEEKFSGVFGFLDGLFGIDGTYSNTFGITAGLRIGQGYGEGTQQGLANTKTKTNAMAEEIGQGISDGVLSKLETMDATQIKVLEEELKNLQSTTENVASGIGSNFEHIRNSVRDNLVGCTNIGRNQFVNLSNIIKNQSQNARNNATSSFISLKKVTSTQISEARNTVTSKMISINSVVNTQSWKARDNGTRAFISLAKVIRTQMSNAYNSVSTYMSKIQSATNKSFSTKINVTKSVTNVSKGAKALLNLNKAVTSSAISYPNTRALALNGFSNISNAKGTNSSTGDIAYFTIENNMDGKTIAKVTAKYMNKELTILDNKNNRKRGKK